MTFRAKFWHVNTTENCIHNIAYGPEFLEDIKSELYRIMTLIYMNKSPKACLPRSSIFAI